MYSPRARLVSNTSSKMPRKNRVGKKKLKGKGAYYPGGRVLRGKGGFFDDIGSIAKSVVGPLISAVGSAADSVIPGASGVANGIRKLVGMGAYKAVTRNAILAQPVPKVNSAQDQGIRYCHEEYLGDVTSSQLWEITQFAVNPGLSDTFPWLSTIASSFQKYRIDGLVFYLRSTSSVAISNTTDLGLGTVLGAFQYNLYDPMPASKVDMLALSGSLSGKPSEDHIYPMECMTSKNVFATRLIRSKGVSDDLAKYDAAKFCLATTGFPGEYALGELWVSYDITLMAPRVEEALPFDVLPGDNTFPNSTELITDTKKFLSVCPLTRGGGPQPEMSNLGWEHVVYTDNYRAWKVPPGTSGRFLISYNAALTGAGAAPDGTFHLQVLQGGSVKVTSYDIGEFSGLVYTVDVGYESLSAGIHVVDVAAEPDKPLLFRFGPNVNSSTTGGTSTFLITRVSDHMVPDASTGTGTVATRSKLRRGNSLAAVAYRVAKSLAPSTEEQKSVASPST